jgi:hypothetical protein
MAFTEDLILKTDDRLHASPITISGDDRFGHTINLSRDHSWSLPLFDTAELRKLGRWLTDWADKIDDERPSHLNTFRLYAERIAPMIGDSRHEVITAVGTYVDSGESIVFTANSGEVRTFRRDVWNITMTPYTPDDDEEKDG